MNISTSIKFIKSPIQRIGRVWNIEDFTVKLSKEGYEFNANQKNVRNFGSIKLSQLIINRTQCEWMTARQQHLYVGGLGKGKTVW